MTFFETLVSFFARAPAETSEAVPEGACPNCWGHFEYDGQVRKAAVDQQLDIVHGEARHAFIRQFMEDHIDGIHLEKTPEGLLCPRCEVVQPHPTE